MSVVVASVLSLKGGVGKTTVALGLASAAVHRGVRTVLVDLDPQANASATLAPEHDPSLPVGRRKRQSRAEASRAGAHSAGSPKAESSTAESSTAQTVGGAASGATAAGGKTSGAEGSRAAASGRKAADGRTTRRPGDEPGAGGTGKAADSGGARGAGRKGADAADSDAAGDAGWWQGQPGAPTAETVLATVADVLASPKRGVVADALLTTSWGPELRLLAGSEHVEAHNHPDPGSKRLSRLATALSKLPDEPELVLIDCPPSLGQLTRSALVASDRAVLVTEPSLYAVTGVQRALEAVQAERTAHRPTLQPLGVVINRVRPRSTEHDFRLAELRDLFGPLVLRPVLPDRSAVQQAQGAAVPIHEWPTPGAREIAGMFDALLDRLLRSGKRR